MLNLRELKNKTNTKENVIDFLMEYKLIPEKRVCTVCSNEMNIQKEGKNKIGYRYRCPRPCRKEISILKDTFFENCSIEMPKILEFIYSWANETCSYKNMLREIGIARSSFVAWRSYCRDICFEQVMKLDYKIGGEGRSVQIDESQFSKRKFNRGQIYPI